MLYYQSTCFQHILRCSPCLCTVTDFNALKRLHSAIGRLRQHQLAAISECCSELCLGFLSVTHSHWSVILSRIFCLTGRWKGSLLLLNVNGLLWHRFPHIPATCLSLSLSIAAHRAAHNGARTSFISTWQLTRQHICAWLPSENWCQVTIPHSKILGGDTIQSLANILHENRFSFSFSCISLPRVRKHMTLVTHPDLTTAKGACERVLLKRRGSLLLAMKHQKGELHEKRWEAIKKPYGFPEVLFFCGADDTMQGVLFFHYMPALPLSGYT